MRVLLLTGMYPNESNPLNGIIVETQRKALESIGIQTGLVHIKPKKRAEFIKSILSLRKAMRSSNYDLVHVHYGFSALAISLFQILPVVVTFHGTDINGAPFNSKFSINSFKYFLFFIVALINRQLSRTAKAVIVMTQEMKSKLPQSVQAKTWVEPMGIDTNIFFQCPKEFAREKLGWGDEPVVVFCNNNNAPIKRQDIAEQAIELIRKKIPSIRLFILKGMKRENVTLVLSAADCLLVTSDKEGSPNIVRESLACNLPIVSVPVGDIPALISNHPSAGIIAQRNPESISDTIIQLLNQKRPNDLDLIIEDNSMINNARRIKKIYEYVLSKN
jgi:teichuronic acid biosynthesis glycosyltransferase TuaC